MVLFSRGVDFSTGATAMVGAEYRKFLGPIGAFFAILGVIVLPITSGDTPAGLRLMVEAFNIDQTVIKNRLLTTLGIFVPAVVILVYGPLYGFNLLWQYFGFTNQFVAIFATASAAVYLMTGDTRFSGLPCSRGCFTHFYRDLSYICHARLVWVTVQTGPDDEHQPQQLYPLLSDWRRGIHSLHGAGLKTGPKGLDQLPQ